MTPVEIFAQLGFNALEAEVYVALLKNGPQTAYKIGKLLGRPTANVYKAVEVLAREGAIEVMETDVKICKAIPIQSVVSQLKQSYDKRSEKAVGVLSKIAEDKSEEGIFKLHTVEAVIQRAKDILSRAESIVVIDAFPNILNNLKDDINKLAGRGVSIYIQAYANTKLDKRISLVVPDVSGEVLGYWDAEQLNIVADGKEMLVSLFNKELSTLIQATYSDNLYLACMMHAGIMSEHKVHLFSKATTMAEVKAIVKGQQFFLNSNVPGLSLLFSQYKK